uniref:Uncharacterized protein n=1 Tax=Glossina brevipalpis TaxID=37001 RepID=A0A1A9WZ36_9MUSC
MSSCLSEIQTKRKRVSSMYLMNDEFTLRLYYCFVFVKLFKSKTRLYGAVHDYLNIWQLVRAAKYDRFGKELNGIINTHTFVILLLKETGCYLMLNDKEIKVTSTTAKDLQLHTRILIFLDVFPHLRLQLYLHTYAQFGRLCRVDVRLPDAKAINGDKELDKGLGKEFGKKFGKEFCKEFGKEFGKEVDNNLLKSLVKNLVKSLVKNLVKDLLVKINSVDLRDTNLKEINPNANKRNY